MPEGLDTALGPARLRDLLTFLLTEPLQAAKIEHEGAPPPRRRAEVDAVLTGSKPVDNPRQLRIVLASGPKDHGPGEHDYPSWQQRWSVLLATAPSVVVETADGWPSTRQLDDGRRRRFLFEQPRLGSWRRRGSSTATSRGAAALS